MNTLIWRRIVTAMLALGVLFGCIVAYVLIMTTRERPTPFAYEDISPVAAYPRGLCPGDLLIFDLRVTIADAPSAVLVAENWQKVGGGSRPDARPVWHIQEEVKVAEVTISIPTPADLSPGQWTFERAGAINTASHPALVVVPFEIREDCP